MSELAFHEMTLPELVRQYRRLSPPIKTVSQGEQFIACAENIRIVQQARLERAGLSVTPNDVDMAIDRANRQLAAIGAVRASTAGVRPSECFRD